MRYRRKIAKDQERFLPAPSYLEYKFDEDGIPMKHFGADLGWQYEPIIPIYYANYYLKRFCETQDATVRKRLEAMLTWLQSQLRPISSPEAQGLTLYSFYDYLPYVKSPWICGMNNGRLVELYLDLFQRFKEESYLVLADDLVAGLMIPIEHGGIRYEFHDGSVVYEEFGNLRPLLWSLNGHCSVIRSLFKYRSFRDASWLDEELRRACASVVRDIHLFDVPEGSGGSKVKAYGPALLRFRPTGLKWRQHPIAIDSILVRYPVDPPLRIEVGASLGNNHAGWSLYETESSRFGPRTWLAGRFVRKVLQGILSFGMTDNFADADHIEFEIDFFSDSKAPVIVELFPNRNKRYVEVGRLSGAPGKWSHSSISVPCSELRRGFGNVVGGDHGYHAMNTDYIEMLAPHDPSGVLQQVARCWRARIASE